MYKMPAPRLRAQQLKPLAAVFASLFVLGESVLAAQPSAPATQPFSGAAMARNLRTSLAPTVLHGPAIGTARPAPAFVASTAVTSCGDDPDDYTTLRHAVLTANSTDTIELAGLQCSKITLTNGAIPVIVDDLKIHGPGAAALTIDGNGSDRVFKHTGAGTFALEDVTVANGVISADKAYGGCIYDKGNLAMTNATLTSCKALGQTAAVGGGAVVFGTITLDSSVVSDNLADAAVGGGMGATSAIGGGVVALSQTEDTTLTHSLVTGNTVRSPSGLAEGGGLLAESLTVKYSTFTGNQAVGGGEADNYSGAGAFVTMYSLFMINSTVDHNQADVAGGMFLANNGFATIMQSTISSNKGNLAIGGIAANLTLSIANSTVAFNTGGAFGGGGLVLDGTCTATLQSTILADNVPSDFDGGMTIDGSNNLVKVVGPNAAMLPAKTKTLDPILGPLAYNGSAATRTHALAAGSPAIDEGNNVANLMQDQRAGNFARTVGAAADIGAFEFDPDRIFADRFGGL